jgi:hypothetical protein
MKMLTLFEDYTRKDVHDIFDPDSAFTTSAGTWGISGIIRVPSRPGDFVLFVTFGQSAGDHVFDEGITASGGPVMAIAAAAGLPRSNRSRVDSTRRSSEFNLSILANR